MPLLSVFEFDDVIAVVDVDRMEFAKDVLAEQPIKVDAKNCGESIEIHDGDGTLQPGVAIELKIYRDGDTFTHETRRAGAVRGAKLITEWAITSDTDDGARGAGIEQENYRSAVDFGLHENHRLRGAKWKTNDFGVSAIGKWKQEQQRKKYETPAMSLSEAGDDSAGVRND